VSAREVALATSFVAACGVAGYGLAKLREPHGPTWSADVAPLVHAKCAPCHHPNGAGPFSLLARDDFAEHAPEIERVTKTRFMPPWRPLPGVAEYANDRSLSAQQIELLARFIAAGEPIGDARAVPPPPSFPDGWQLGTPDLVVELPEAYDLAAGGLDVYRNFVIPHVVDKTRFVDAWELRPHTRVIHHAILNVDRTGLARQRDERDPGPGFGGIDVGDVQNADGFYLVWTPGRTAGPRTPDRSWRLDAQTDLVLQLHMQPSGKPEHVRPTIGLYFSNHPPKQPEATVRVGDPPIDIPANDPHWVARAEYTLPVDALLLSAFPHAHYLARDVHTWAVLPDGRAMDLVHIADWDFAWQDLYTFAKPITVPRGTKLELEIAYDNSAKNPKNPSHPPRRVTFGESSVDEMGNVTFQIAPQGPGAMNVLRETRYRAALASSETAKNHYNLANVLFDLGRVDEAITHFERALAIDPTLVPARLNLAVALARRGDLEGAKKEVDTVLHDHPDDAAAKALRERL
jgi:hypothetical protein